MARLETEQPHSPQCPCASCDEKWGGTWRPPSSRDWDDPDRSRNPYDDPAFPFA